MTNRLRQRSPQWFCAVGLVVLLAGCGDDGDDGDGVAVNQPSSAERALVYGQGCSPTSAAGAGALLFDGRANFGGGLEDVHTVLCSAVLIRPDVALTAAHCIELEALGASFVAEAEFSISFESDVRDIIESGAPFPADAVLVRAWTVHPSFDATAYAEATGLSEESDLAVLFLDTPRFDIALPSVASTDGAVDVGTQLTLAGYGTTDAATSPAQAGGIGRRRCVNSFVNATSASEFQVGSGATTGRRCYGDSGGPTYLRSAPETLVGIGSRAWSADDGCTVGSVDVLLSAFGPFLQQTLEAGCADGGPRTACNPTVSESDGGASDAGATVDEGIDAGQLDANDLDSGFRSQDAGETDVDGSTGEPEPIDGGPGDDAGVPDDAGVVQPGLDAGARSPDAGDGGLSDNTCSCILVERGMDSFSRSFAGLFLFLLIGTRRRRGA